MKNFIVALAAASFGALTAGACGGDDSYYSPGGGYVPPAACAQLTTCGTCTPVIGCGWCYDSDGTGLCAADPDECPTPSFSWTWNESGCRVAADAGVTSAPTSPVADGGAGTDAYWAPDGG